MMNHARTMRYRTPSGARGKLNQSYATGALLIAAFLGLVFSSWWTFGVAAAILLALNVLGGNIRITR